LKRFTDRKDLFTAHANELLHMAANNESANFEEIIQVLMTDFGADPNGIVDGKTPLFCCEIYENIENLLAAGADPFVEIDGRLFFEREVFPKSREREG
jgi:hypothetical protein